MVSNTVPAPTWSVGYDPQFVHELEIITDKVRKLKHVYIVNYQANDTHVAVVANDLLEAAELVMHGSRLEKASFRNLVVHYQTPSFSQSMGRTICEIELLLLRYQDLLRKGAALTFGKGKRK